MPSPLPSLCLVGATVLSDGVLVQRPLSIADGRIVDGALGQVDMTGYLVLPGIIDLHGEAFERHVAPGPSAPFPLKTGLTSTDRDAAANGVTTAWLAQSWSWEGGRRGPDFALQVMEAMQLYRSHGMLTDMRLQIRCETHTVETEARLLGAIRHYGIDYVVFNNHLDQAELTMMTRPEELLLWAQSAGRTSKEHLQFIRQARQQIRDVPRYLCRLARAFDEMGVTYGSHDDPDGETREMYSMIGAKICEFPTARSAAALAHAVHDPILMGAPNVVRGGSQSGNISAAELLRAGLCNVLVSDFYYPSLSQAAFRLADEGLLTFEKAWALISSTPANVMNLRDRGTLSPGKRADLVIVKAETRAIEATLSGGRITHLSGEAAHRFTAACIPRARHMAAE